MNPDFAIILNFDLKTSNVDQDYLVKEARNIGVRAIMADDSFLEACQKYSIALLDKQAGLDLTAENAIDTIVENRIKGQATIINLAVEADGKLADDNLKMLSAINDWMHLFGHALNESEPSELKTSYGYILTNRHATYQKYIFVKTPLPDKLTVSGLKQAPNRVEWIADRTEAKFSYDKQELTIDLSASNSEFAWEIIRIQAHRPEDDLGETKF